MDISDDMICDEVEGAEVYTVQIHYNKDSIIDMECDCPYAGEGKNCGHMVTALLEYENNKVHEDTNIKGTYNEKGIDTLIKQANESQVHQFLHYVLSQDNKLLLQFQSMIKMTLSYYDIKEYENQIDCTVDTYVGRDRYITYDEVYEFIDDMVNHHLNQDVRPLFVTNHYKTAFELSVYLYRTIGMVEMDDLGGYTRYFFDECIEIWYDILEYASANLKDEMYQFFMEQIVHPFIDCVEDDIIDLVMNDFYEEKYLNDKLNFTQRRVESK